MSKIYIGVGHGGKDGGATCGERKEKDFALALANLVTLKLRTVGHIVKQSRTADVDFTTDKKAPDAKSFGAELIVDIHFNSFNKSANGTEVYYSATSEKGKKIATDMSSAISSALGTRNRGAAIRLLSNGKDYYQVIRECPFATSLLAEICFIDNDEEMSKYNAEKAAQAIVTAILNTFAAPIHTSSTTHSTAPASAVRLTKGKKLTLKNVGLYGGIMAKTPVRRISGTFYCYDGLKYSGYTRITTSPMDAGRSPQSKYVTGWIKVEDIK